MTRRPARRVALLASAAARQAGPQRRQRGHFLFRTTRPYSWRRLSLAVALAGGLVLIAFGLTALESEAKPSCGGRKATIVRGAGDDVIRAPKKGPQVIVAGAGNDTIIAKRNRDIVCAGDGNNYILGGTGRDRLFGEAGDDLIVEGPGSGLVAAGDGDDTV